MKYNIPIFGGIDIGGTAIVTTPKRMRDDGCFCGIQYTEIATGGLRCGGSAIEDDGVFHGSGGMTCGGSCYIDLQQDPWDGIEFVLPLFEDGGPYIDRSRNHLDGTAAGGGPTQEEGLYCLNSQAFNNDSWIDLPADSIGINQPFTVTLFVNWHGYFEQSVMYSRGHDDGTNENIYALSRTVAVHPLAMYNTDGTYSPEFSYGTPLELEKFYHIASSWDGTNAKIYVNGELVGTTTLRHNLKELTNSCYIGRFNAGGIPDANIMFVRLYPEVKSAAWIKAEHDLFCNPEFYYVDKKLTPTYG